MNSLTRTLPCFFLFAALGANFSSAGEEKSHQRETTVEVRVTFVPGVWKGRDYENGPGVEELCASTKEVLEARFPWAVVDVVDDPLAGIYEYRIRGASTLSNLQLELLGTAQSEMSLHLAATSEDFANNVDVAAETARARNYLTRPRSDLAAFNALPWIEGGAHKGIVYAWETLGDEQRRVVPLIEDGPSFNGTGNASIVRVHATRDSADQPALGFQIKAGNEAQRRAFIAKHLGNELTVVVGTEILARLKVTDALRTGGVITREAPGSRTVGVDFLLALLEASRLPLRMRLLSVERSSR